MGGMDSREEWIVPQLTDSYGIEVPVIGGYLDGRTVPATAPVLFCALESSEEIYRLQQNDDGDLRWVYSRTRPRVAP
jgi:hypothetical protein